MDGDRNGVGARQPRHPAAAREDDEIVAATVTSMRARRRAEPRVQRRQSRTAACRRPTKRWSICSASPSAAWAAGSSTSTARRRGRARSGPAAHAGPGQVLRETGERRVDPERLFARRARAARTGTCGVSSPARRTRRQERRPPQRLHARRRQLVGAARERLAAADHGQRQSEAHAGRSGRRRRVASR